MPSPFDNIQFAKYNKQYVSQPIDTFADTVNVLNQRYDQGVEMNDALQQAMSSIKVDDVNNQHLANRAAIINDNLRGLINKGDFENGYRLIKTQFNDLSNDKAVRSSIEHYNARNAKKEELRKKYETGYFDKELYDDEIANFNNYQGIGTPDDLGFYNNYEHVEGAKYVDLTELTKKALSMYKGGNESSTSTSTLSYDNNGQGLTADQAKVLGMPSGQTTKVTKLTDGTEAAAIAQAALISNPDAVAYADRLVDIRNRKGILNTNGLPFTRDDIFGEYADRARRSYGSYDTMTASEEQATQMTADTRAHLGSRTTEPDGVTPIHTTLLPSVTLTTGNPNDLVGGELGRFMSNLGNVAGGIAQTAYQNTPLGTVFDWTQGNVSGSTVLNRLTPANLASNLRNTWKDKNDYTLQQVANLTERDQERLSMYIKLYGKDTDKAAVQSGLTNMSPAEITAAVTNIKNNPASKDILKRSDYMVSLYGIDKQAADELIPKGATLGSLVQLPVSLQPMFDYDGDGYKNTLGEYITSQLSNLSKDERKAMEALPVVVLGALGENKLTLATGSPDMNTGLIIKLGNKTIAVGTGDLTDKRSRKQQVHSLINSTSQEAYVNASYASDPANPYAGGTPVQMENPFYKGNAKNILTVDAYKVNMGGSVSVKYRVTNPVTGNVSERDNLQGALFDLSDKDAPFSGALREGKFNTYYEILQEDEDRFKNVTK